MTSLLAAFVLLHPGVEDFQELPRRRETLENGAVLVTQQMPEARQFVLTITWSADNARDMEETWGLRHMWEHLMLRRPGAMAVDPLLEMRGCLLTAQTTRDYTLVQIVGPLGSEGVAIESLRRLVQPIEVSEDAVAHEARIMAQEYAVRPWSDDVTDAAWVAAFGPYGRSPFGPGPDFTHIKASEIESLHRRQMGGHGMSVVLAGQFPGESTHETLKALLTPLPAGPERFADSEDEPVVTRHGRSDQGAAVSAIVPGLGDPALVASLAAAFVHSVENGVQVVYTPTARPALISLVAQEPAGLEFSRKGPPDTSQFELGRRMIQRYVGQIESDPAMYGAWFGPLLVQRPGFTIDDLKTQSISIRPEQFEAGWARFNDENAVKVQR